jgi:hypothetical protein
MQDLNERREVGRRAKEYITVEFFEKSTLMYRNRLTCLSHRVVFTAKGNFHWPVKNPSSGKK